MSEIPAKFVITAYAQPFITVCRLWRYLQGCSICTRWTYFEI